MRRILAGAMVVATALAVATPAAAIVYGETTEEYDNVPAIIGVLSTADGPEEYLWCTGTLIAADAVLSAAHCFPTWDEIEAGMPDRFTGISYAVAFAPDGTIPLEINGDVITAADDPDDGVALLSTTGRPVLMPGFPGPASDLRDVAVLKLATDAPATIVPAVVAPVGYLNTVARSDPSQSPFTTVGYGFVRDTRTKAWQSLEPPDGVRRVAPQPMLSLTKAWLTLSMNEARGHGGTCYGDSGGPHFHGDVLVSLTVTGDSTCKATDKTYRLDTPLVQEFLNDTLNN